MKILIILNGYNLRRYPRGLPAELGEAVRAEGHLVTVRVSKSLDHMMDLIGKGVEAGADTLLLGGGDGTLHHAVNHPAAGHAAIGMIPLGTINAFLRSARVPWTNPLRALEATLAGRVIEGHCGLINGRRFACFASWGYDARVVHNNPTELKRRIRALSYGVTGIREFAGWRAGAVEGEVHPHPGNGRARRATSVIVSKIDNYAGAYTFSQSLESGVFDAMLCRSDDPLTTAGFWLSLGMHRPLGKRHLPIGGCERLTGLESLTWSSDKPTLVQLDGEAIVLEGTHALSVTADPRTQRYLWPKGRR